MQTVLHGVMGWVGGGGGSISFDRNAFVICSGRTVAVVVAAAAVADGVGTIWEIIFKLNLTSSRATRRMRSGIFINYLFI